MPDAFLELIGRRQATGAQCVLDHFQRAHLETGMAGAETLGEGALHLVVGAAFGVGGHDRPADLQKGVGPGGVDVVVLEKGRRG